MSRKSIRINQGLNPPMSLNSLGIIPIKYNMNRAKSPLLLKRKIKTNNFISEDENIYNNSLNKSINSQTFIYNNINFSSNQNSCHNLLKNKKNRASMLSLLPSNDITSKFNKIIKNNNSMSKKNINKYINKIFFKTGLNNNLSVFNNLNNKRKAKSLSKKKNTQITKKKKFFNKIKINNVNLVNKHINMNNLKYLNTAEEINGRNIKKKIIISNNHNINKNSNKKLISKYNNSNDKDKNINKIVSKRYLHFLSDIEKKIINQIKKLIRQLLSISSKTSKPLILKELQKIFEQVILINNKNYLSEQKSIKNYNEKNKKILKNSNQLNNNNKNMNKYDCYNIEDKINILNNKFDKIEEENINLKNIISEKNVVFEDVKNSLKSFQDEINKLKNINNSNSNKNLECNNINDNLEIKNANLKNILKINEIDELKSNKSRNNQNNICNAILENNKSNIIINSNTSFDPFSITFNNQFPITEDKDINSSKNILLNCNESSPSWKKSSYI